MSCKGKCQVQIYDVDLDGGLDDMFNGVRFKLLTKRPNGCPDSPPDDRSDEVEQRFQRFVEKVSGCEEKECACIPVDENPKWTDWQRYFIEPPIKFSINIGDGAIETCEYEASGMYYVSSAVVEGACMKDPSTLARRLRSHRPKWWKKQEGRKKKQE